MSLIEHTLPASPPPMMIESRISTPQQSAAFTSLLTSEQSAPLGTESPDGWLCTRMMLAALATTAGFRTSLGWTTEAFSDPIETSTLPMRLFLVESNKISNRSRSAALKSAQIEATSSGPLTFTVSVS